MQVLACLLTRPPLCVTDGYSLHGRADLPRRSLTAHCSLTYRYLYMYSPIYSIYVHGWLAHLHRSIHRDLPGG